ncbi:MAG: S8 family peptidase [Thermoanaerobaculia bacterium]
MPLKPPNLDNALQPPRPAGYRPRVVVKLRDFVAPAQARSMVGELALRAQAALNFRPLFELGQEGALEGLIRRASELDPSYRAPRLGHYFVAEVPADTDPEAVVRALSSLESVALAYVEPPPVEPPMVMPADDPRSGNQGYLDAAPDGIDARYAWGFAGGDGAGQAVVDLEQGWTFNHEDLVAHGVTLISGLNQAYFFHGTGVLGELAASDNTLGCVGITPNLASVRCVSQWRNASTYSTSEAILSALATMSSGDILLLEAQTVLWGYTFVPVEVEPAVFDAIRLATALGIVVVEAAGNGSVDLDTLTNPSGQHILDRASADFQDSGAIVVGAGSSTAPHSRLGFSCHGSRVDCYGWGENVDTLTTDGPGTATNLYTPGFSGTSSASPIVTGAALAVQGLAQAQLGHRLSPQQLRHLLADPALGTPSDNPALDRIGVMPNLRAILESDVLNLAPDVYLRDFVGDTGDPHSGSISASPDVILRPTAVGSPQATYGEGSGTENNADLGSEAEAGQDNFLYVRMRNRGGSAATNVEATVYWSPPATLVTPDLWTLVGSTTLASVPTGNQLTVAPAITWPMAAIPGPGHYCFVALVGTAADPAPAPADLFDWDTFSSFVRSQNNVTWRNFNVVNNVPPSTPGKPPSRYVELPFLAAGAPDRARKMQIEVVGRLPAGAEAVLEMAPQFARKLRAHSRPIPLDRPEQIRRAHVPLNPCGRNRFLELPLPAKARIPLRLLVHLPEKERQGEFEIYARQLYQGEEVGRVTWKLVPPGRQPRP